VLWLIHRAEIKIKAVVAKRRRLILQPAGPKLAIGFTVENFHYAGLKNIAEL
jgi:hypothetical protein